jgi:hypothetical protein
MHDGSMIGDHLPFFLTFKSAGKPTAFPARKEKPAEAGFPKQQAVSHHDP